MEQDPNSPSPADPIADAKALLKQDQDTRINNCKSELEQILSKYNCEMIVAMLVTPAGNSPQVTIVPKS